MFLYISSSNYVEFTSLLKSVSFKLLFNFSDQSQEKRADRQLNPKTILADQMIEPLSLYESLANEKLCIRLNTPKQHN